MEDGGDLLRKWDELLPDALGLIFKNLSLRELLTVVPRVCKSWSRVVTGPYCWQEIDIEEWSRSNTTDIVDQMVQTLIARSCGSLRKLAVSGLASEQTISVIANQCSMSTNFATAEKLHKRFSDGKGSRDAIKYHLYRFELLHIHLGAQTLEAIGKHCKSLTTLRRIMHPLEVIDKHSQDDEALAIANTMPRLKHLEIAYLLVNTSSIIEILEKCKNLELLDVRGCWNVNLEEKFVKRFSKLKMVGPLVVDCYDMNGWDNCSDFSGSSGYLAWDFVAGDMDDDHGDMVDDLWEDEHAIDDVEMWFYDDVNAVDAGYDWPQSP